MIRATAGEVRSASRFFEAFLAKAEEKSWSHEKAMRLATTTFCQSLIASAEFRYLQ